MRRWLILFLAALLCAGTGARAAEGGAPAVLRYSSFDGGGHEYSVGIDDPSVLACEASYDYGGDALEVVDGAAYTLTFTFTGLKPGSTTVWVYGRSPVMENDDALYTAEVDDSLNVTLTAVRAISTLFLYRSSSDDSYHVTHERDGYLVSVSDGEARPIDDAPMAALAQVVDAYDLARWDDFGESRQGVAHGESFWLEIGLTDGTRILARGQNAYPEDYFPAMDAMQAILEAAAAGGGLE